MARLDSGFRKCSYCDKEFIPAPYHMYRAKGKIQCSYTCYRKEGGDSGKYSKSRKSPKK